MAPSIFDDFSYQDIRNVESGTDLSAADDRTLRMAALPLDEAMLDALIRFQETFLAHVGALTSAEAMAAAHAEAVRISGLAPQVVESGTALLRAFCGRRWAVAQLQARLARWATLDTPDAPELRARLQQEVAKQERATDALARRYGDTTLALLRQREAPLLDLHSRLTRLLSRG
ncbi:hypothetical protein DRW03_09440 [Corallococcus sp. H22C18031201]|uniref:hypothetical protein n=1 Tax=Citreicoccus inhibens TaxID=2849499 RepID=UPI000E71264B|nr:hypothetical protein [Citreicoccus inhibens]MBU8894736.1 hypothetical protein [Citreicoccus inhibens]RJS25309.1 hypothetical protein DRW03_09440 [Corallococcus sp. H22C18031201]